MAVCAACREVGLDRELVAASARSGRVDGHAASPGPGSRSGVALSSPSRQPGAGGCSPCSDSPRLARRRSWPSPSSPRSVASHHSGWAPCPPTCRSRSGTRKPPSTIPSTRDHGKWWLEYVTAPPRRHPPRAPLQPRTPGSGRLMPLSDGAARPSDPLASPPGGRRPHRTLILAACGLSGGGSPSEPAASAGPTTSSGPSGGQPIPPPDHHV